MSRGWWYRVVAAVGSVCLLASCAPARMSWPVDPGRPLPDAAAVHTTVTAACRGIRTFTAELGMSGRVGGTRLGGRVLAGFDRAGSMRLEGVAPFGPPAFILAAVPGNAVLLLPRDRQVLRDSDPAAVLGALSGLSLSSSDLLAVVTGCVTPDPRPTTGRVHANGLASIDLGAGATVWLRRAAGAWVLRGARRPPWEVEYDLVQNGLPRLVRLTSDAGERSVTLSVTLSQIEANVDIPAWAFVLDVPAGLTPLSLDDLRTFGPLRER